MQSCKSAYRPFVQRWSFKPALYGVSGLLALQKTLTCWPLSVNFSAIFNILTVDLGRGRLRPCDTPLVHVIIYYTPFFLGGPVYCSCQLGNWQSLRALSGGLFCIHYRVKCKPIWFIQTQQSKQRIHGAWWVTHGWRPGAFASAFAFAVSLTLRLLQTDWLYKALRLWLHYISLWADNVSVWGGAEQMDRSDPGKHFKTFGWFVTSCVEKRKLSDLDDFD